MENNLDLRIEIRFKNARLYNAIRDRFSGIAEKLTKGPGAIPLMRVAAETLQVSYTTLIALCGLRLSPYKKGRLSDPAKRIVDFFEVEPESLFPQELYKAKFPRMIAGDVSAEIAVSQLSARAVAGLLSSPDYDRPMALEVLKESIESVLGTLKLREADIVRRRFGLPLYDEEQTLQEVADAYHLSRDRIRQIEARALRLLRHPERSQHLLKARVELGELSSSSESFLRRAYRL